MSTYNYNTLTRTNDGNDFEFNTNCNVLYVDSLPASTTLSLKIDSTSNQAITLREKTQLRFKQNNRLFFSPSSSTAETIRIFLYLDESNLLEFDQSQYSSESTISGTVTIDGTVDIVSINGNTDNSDNWVQILEQSNSGGLRKNGYTIINQATSNTVILTIPASKVFYLHGISHVTNCSNVLGGLTYYYLYDASGSLVSALSVSQLTSTLGNNQAQIFNFSVPIKMVASETLQIVSNANVYQNITYFGYEFDA